MAEIIDSDDIDFSLYERETEAQQKVKDASIWVQELIDRIKNPVRSQHTLMPWAKTHNRIQFRPGEVTVWGGANGHGKSLVTGQVALSLCAQGEKVCIASFEMKPIKTLERMATQWAGPDMDSSAGLIDSYEQFRDWTNGKLFLYDQQGTVTARQVFAVVRYCAKERGITHVFIDSLMKCVAGEDDYNGQKAFVDELTAIARDHGIHVHLVHHIKKPESEDSKPNKYAYKGSGSITDQVDNVISVWRNKAKERAKEGGKTDREKEHDCLLICDKQRNGDWEGTIGLWFDRPSMQFVGEAGQPSLALYENPRLSA